MGSGDQGKPPRKGRGGPRDKNMGKKKVQIIDPKKAQHFYLVRRSQHDAAGHLDNASTHVLIPANKGQSKSGGAAAQLGWETASVSSQRSSLREARDHINELGLPNDGYDYSQHLKEIGGGRFIAPDGRVCDMESAKSRGMEELGLPEEVFPSTEIERRLDSITISADCMDQDMAAALFSDEEDYGEEEEGGFEELDDDFVLQAAEEPEEEEGGAGDGGFDYEAHMARLMEASERALGWAPARGWEEGEVDELQLLRKGRGMDDDDEEFSDYDEDDDDEEEQRRRYPVPKDANAERYKAERGFADLLSEYDEDEIGELEEPAEEGAATRGHIELEEVNGYFEQVLDEFLESARQEREDNAYVKPQTVEAAAGGGKKKTKRLGAIREEEEAAQATAPPTAEDEEEEEEPLLEEDFDEFIRDHAYLGDVREKSEWDCETVLTTCSNTDNLPTVIGEPLSKAGQRRRRQQLEEQGKEEGGAENGGVPSVASLIELSRKTGLPRGVLPEKDKKEKVVGENLGEPRAREESKEEKAARKAAVKQARKETRERKKGSRLAFKEAEAVVVNRARNPEAATGRRLFRYSA